MKKNYVIFTILFIVTVVLFFAYLYKKNIISKNQSNLFHQSINKLINNPVVTSNKVNLSESNNIILNEGSIEKSQMFQIRKAFIEIDLRDKDQSKLLTSLTALTLGLNSENQIIRSTTDDFVVHLLTRWAALQPEDNWHLNNEIDLFFSTYKKLQTQSLTKFLKIYKNSPEEKYLTSL